MMIANYFLLSLGVPKQADVVGFALLITPILTLPFFHFLYDLIGVHPLSVQHLLVDFRLRGAIAIILSANVIFIALEPLQHILGLIIHLALALLALYGLFFLCAQRRTKPSVFSAPFLDRDYGLPPMLLQYGAAILEVFYYLLIIGNIFLAGLLETVFMAPLSALNFSLMLFGLLILVSFATKIRFLFGSTISLALYEEQALPLSFLVFGIMNVFRYYF
jgi:hypothetical protein